MWSYLLELFRISGELSLNLFVALGTSLLLSLFIALVYHNTHRGLNYEPSFLNTLALIAPIVALVMFFIRGDLVLSLGLVGSLSIIRFRTPIKDSRDMAYLFWAISVGLGCGTGNWTLALMATIFIAIVTFLLYIFEYGYPKHSDFVMVITGSDTPSGDTESVIRRHAARSRVRSREVNEKGWEIVYELRFTRAQQANIDRLISEMQAVKGVQRVSLLAPQLALPM